MTAKDMMQHACNHLTIIIIILFISYKVVQQDVVCKKTPQKVQNMVWPTIQLHGHQIHDYVVSITLVHSIIGHSVVTYHNTLSNNASIDVIILFILLLYLLVMGPFKCYVMQIGVGGGGV